MIDITFPIPEKVSMNKIYAGFHWSKRKKLADLYHSYMLAFRKEKVVSYPVDITYEYTFKSKPLDSLNCALVSKMIEDGMVGCGILKGDDPVHVRSSTLSSKKGDRDEVHIIIT